MYIVTGPRIELAIMLIDGMKPLLERFHISFGTKETVIELNRVHIEVYPSHHLDAMRGAYLTYFFFSSMKQTFPLQGSNRMRGTFPRYI